MKKLEPRKKPATDTDGHPMMDTGDNPMMIDDRDDDRDNATNPDDDPDDDVESMMEEGKRFWKGNIEYRAIELRASILDTEEGQPILKVLEGRAIVFDTPTPLFQDYDGTTYSKPKPGQFSASIKSTTFLW